MLRTADLVPSSADNAISNHFYSEKQNGHSISFAQSLDEGSEIAWSMQDIGNKDPKNLVRPDDGVFGKSRNAVIVLENTGTKSISSSFGISKVGHNPNSDFIINSNKKASPQPEMVNLQSGEIASITARPLQKKPLDTNLESTLDLKNNLSSGKERYRQSALITVASENENISNATKRSQQAASPNGTEKQQRRVISNKAKIQAPAESKKSKKRSSDSKIDTDLRNKDQLITFDSAAITMNTVTAMQLSASAMTLSIIKDLAVKNENDRGTVTSYLGEVNSKVIVPTGAIADKKDSDGDSKEMSVANESHPPNPVHATESSTGTVEAKGAPDATKVSLIEKVTNTVPTLSHIANSSVIVGTPAGNNSANQSKYLNERHQSSQNGFESPHLHLQMHANDVDAVPEKMQKTLMLTPTSLAVGVANGTHGWLTIHAEMTKEGLVNASLSTSSPSTEEMLQRQLPSLSVFLKDERVAVNTVVIQPASPSREAIGMAGNGSGQEHREQAQYDQTPGGGNQQGGAGGAFYETKKNEMVSIESNPRTGNLLVSNHYASGGSWLSVRA